MNATVSLHDILEELRERDEAIDKLVVAYFKLEQRAMELEKELAEAKRTFQLTDARG